jgi:hypothetical protein
MEWMVALVSVDRSVTKQGNSMDARGTDQEMKGEATRWMESAWAD